MPSYRKYWGINSLYGMTVSQGLPLGGLKLGEETSQFNEDFMKYYNDNSDKGSFLEVYFQYFLKNLHKFTIFTPFA